MIWGSEAIVVSCMSDPYCRQDFSEDDASKGIEGVIPSWKMITASYVSDQSPRDRKPRGLINRPVGRSRDIVGVRTTRGRRIFVQSARPRMDDRVSPPPTPSSTEQAHTDEGILRGTKTVSVSRSYVYSIHA